jgi:hypothetical protein
LRKCGGELAIALQNSLLCLAPLCEFGFEPRICLLEGDGAFADTLFERFVAALELKLRALALDGVPERPDEKVIIDVSFDEVILRAELDGLDGERDVLHAAEHHDWQVGRSFAEPQEGVHACAVGQREVDQDEIDAALAELREAGSQGIGDRNLKGSVFRPGQKFPEKAHVFLIVFDEKNVNQTTI